MLTSFLNNPTVRLYWLNADPVATAVVDAADEVADGFAVGAADVDVEGTTDVDACGAADDDAGDTGLVAEVVAVPLQPASKTVITMIPTRTDNNFLTFIYPLFIIILFNNNILVNNNKLVNVNNVVILTNY